MSEAASGSQHGDSILSVTDSCEGFLLEYKGPRRDSGTELLPKLSEQVEEAAAGTSPSEQWVAPIFTFDAASVCYPKIAIWPFSQTCFSHDTRMLMDTYRKELRDACDQANDAIERLLVSEPCTKSQSKD